MGRSRAEWEQLAFEAVEQLECVELREQSTREAECHVEINTLPAESDLRLF